MAKPQGTRPTTTAQIRPRLRSAEAYLEVADLVLGEKGRVEMPGVAAGLAVLAGIAGADVICAVRLAKSTEAKTIAPPAPCSPRRPPTARSWP